MHLHFFKKNQGIVKVLSQLTAQYWPPANLTVFSPCFLEYKKFSFLYPGICILLAGFSKLDVGYYTPEPMNYHSLGVFPQPGSPSGYPLKIIKFQACPQDPQKSDKVAPGSPKVLKKTPKTTPGTPI